MSKKENDKMEIVKVMSNLPTLDGWKEKCLQAVSDNPFIKIVDAATSKQARANRTSLKGSRVDLQKQRTVINKKLAEVRESVKGDTDNLIDIMLPHEERQQVEIDAYDEIKAEEKRLKEKKEENRINLIKGRISETEFDCNEIIDLITIEDSAGQFTNLKIVIAAGKKTGEEDFDFMEFEVLEEDMERRMIESFDKHLAELVAAEKTARENLEKEQKAKIDSIFRECTELIFNNDLSISELEEGIQQAVEIEFDSGIHLALFNDTKKSIDSQVETRIDTLQKEQEMQDREDRMTVLEELATYREGVLSGIENITLETELKNTSAVRLLIDKPSLKNELIPIEWRTFTELAEKKLIARKKVLDKLQEDEDK